MENEDSRPTTLLMKKMTLLLFAVWLVCNANAQGYASLAYSLTATPGTISDKSNLSLEYGKQWDVFSLGIDLGKTSLAHVLHRDTAAYVELRPNLNIFQQGRFTNTLTTGVGFVFHAKENLLMEFTSGIEYAYSGTLHFNIFFGQYFYSGRYSASNVNFLGLSAAYYFKPTLTGSVFKKGANKD